jgi:hypothetical protein
MTDVGSDDARITELMGELNELRDRHQAVARVFQGLARSQMRLQLILDQFAEAARSLCRSDYSLIHLVEGELLHFHANVGVPAAVMEYDPVTPRGAGHPDDRWARRPDGRSGAYSRCRRRPRV